MYEITFICEVWFHRQMTDDTQKYHETMKNTGFTK